MRFNITSTVITCLLATFTAGGVHAAEVPQIVTDLVAEAKTQVDTIDMETFRKVIDSKAYDYIIDVREPDEFAAGHIPGAINIPRGVIEFRIWVLTGYPESTDTSIRLYIYCKTGGRCALAARSLQALGFTHVIAVDMMLADWQAAGHLLTVPEADF
jgi:rhodanese-related sulfurtransferase